MPDDKKVPANATIGDAVEYVKADPSGVGKLFAGVKWLIGLVVAFFKK